MSIGIRNPMKIKELTHTMQENVARILYYKQTRKSLHTHTYIRSLTCHHEVAPFICCQALCKGFVGDDGLEKEMQRKRTQKQYSSGNFTLKG